jgi:hypothetical protein
MWNNDNQCRWEGGMQDTLGICVINSESWASLKVINATAETLLTTVLQSWT